MKKIFKKIPLSNNRYEVANDGEVRSNINGTIKTVKHSITNNGYSVVGIYSTTQNRTSTMVSKLVMEAFGLPKPGKEYVIHYVDFDKQNCSIDNLVWMLKTDVIKVTWIRNNLERKTNMGARGRRMVMCDVDNNFISAYDSIKTASKNSPRGTSEYRIMKSAYEHKVTDDCRWYWLEPYELNNGKLDLNDDTYITKWNGKKNRNKS